MLPLPLDTGKYRVRQDPGRGRGEPGSQEKSGGLLVVLWGSREAKMPGAWNSAVRPRRRERTQAAQRGRGTERLPAAMRLLDFCLVAVHDQMIVLSSFSCLEVTISYRRAAKIPQGVSRSPLPCWL